MPLTSLVQSPRTITQRASMKQLAYEQIERTTIGKASTSTATVTDTYPRDALVTQKPIFKRSTRNLLDFDDPRFIGYGAQGGGDDGSGDDEGGPTVIQHTCNVNYTFATSGSYYGCCASASSTCSFATNCVGPTVEYEGGYQLFEGGVISRCAGYCVTAALYRSVDDKSPYTRIGCSDDYRALRTINANAAADWVPPTTLAPGPPMEYTTTRTLGLTPTPGEVLVTTDNEGIIQEGFEITWHINLTKVSGGIAAGIVLLGLVLCCVWGRWRRNRAARRRMGMGGRKEPSRAVNPLAPGIFNWNQTPQEHGVISGEEHELNSMPEQNLPSLGSNAPPAYQVFAHGPQRAGYESL